MDNLPNFSTRYAGSSLKCENYAENSDANVGDQRFVLEQVPTERIRPFVPQIPKIASSFLISSCGEEILLETFGIDPWDLHGIPVGRTLLDGSVEIASGLRTYEIAKAIAAKSESAYQIPVFLGDFTDTQMFDLHLQTLPSLELMPTLQQGHLWRYCVEKLGWNTAQIFDWLLNRGGRAYSRSFIRSAIALTFLPSWLQSEILLSKVSQPVAIALGDLGERNTEIFYKNLQATTLKSPEKLKFLRRVLTEVELDLDSLSPQDIQDKYDEFFPVLQTSAPESQSSGNLFTLRLVEAENEISLESLLNSTLSSLRHDLNISINSIHWHKRFAQIQSSLEKNRTPAQIRSVTLVRALLVALCLDSEGNINPLFQPLLALRGIDSRPALLKYLEDSRDDQILEIGLYELLDLTAPFNPYISRLLKAIFNKPRLPELPSDKHDCVSIYFDPDEIRGNFYNGNTELIPTLILHGLEEKGHRFRISDLKNMIRSVSGKVLGSPGLLSHVRLEGIPNWLIEHLGLHRTSEGIFWYQQSVIDGGPASYIEPGVVESKLLAIIDKQVIPPHERGELLSVNFLESGVTCLTVRFPKQICSFPPESLYLHPEDLQAIRRHKIPKSVHSRQAA
jgi:hypothetical protein